MEWENNRQNEKTQKINESESENAQKEGYNHKLTK